MTSPANSEAAKLYKENIREYEKRVINVVQESWVDEEGDYSEDEKDGE